MYRALREGAGLLERSSRGLIAIGGSDRADYLQGQLTNDIVALADGEGCYSAHLTPNGRMIADMDVFSVGDHVFLDVDGGVKHSLVTRFQDLIFAEDVVVSDRTESWTSYGVSGPESPGIVSAALESVGAEGQPTAETLVDYQVAQLLAGDAPLITARTDFLGMPGFSLWVERAGADSLREALIDKGCTQVDGSAAEVVRIENGRPVFPTDLGEGVIPLEAGIEDRAISFTKGCYVGQEVIIRVLHRGKGRVARRLTGLKLGIARCCLRSARRGDLVGWRQGCGSPDERGLVSYSWQSCRARLRGKGASRARDSARGRCSFRSLDGHRYEAAFCIVNAWQSGRIGHSVQRGFRGVQTIAPKSISAWLKSNTRSRGRTAEDNSQRCRFVAWLFGSP